ncbi:MAG: hypothetical protein KDE31_38315, partial [Caldilineaceae bacterium]|nr:hypothetical protein [Caldilineaceae bacterium]
SSADIIRYQRAAATYHGPLLQGFYLDDCAEFEEWLLLTREQLQRRALATLRALTEYYAQLGDLAQALHYAQQRLALEPWLEDVHRQVMVWLAQSGQRSAALAQFERCRHALVEELSIEPSAETIALYEAIRAGSYAKVLSREERSVSPQAEEERATQLLNESLGKPPKGSTATSMGFARKRALGPDAQRRDPDLSLPQHNLPAPTTPRLGRVSELRDLQGLLQRTDVRLVTLTGPGGVGKTRLGLAVAHAALPHFHDGVFVVQLAAIREAALVITAIAQTLAISEKGTLDLLTQIEVALRNRNLLLLLDNFEQVLQAAPFVAQLLAACPGLKVLVTSRERLALQGEHEYVTPPLPTPSDD